MEVGRNEEVTFPNWLPLVRRRLSYWWADKDQRGLSSRGPSCSLGKGIHLIGVWSEAQGCHTSQARVCQIEESQHLFCFRQIWLQDTVCTSIPCSLRKMDAEAKNWSPVSIGRKIRMEPNTKADEMNLEQQAMGYLNSPKYQMTGFWAWGAAKSVVELIGYNCLLAIGIWDSCR